MRESRKANKVCAVGKSMKKRKIMKIKVFAKIEKTKKNFNQRLDEI